MIWQDIVIGASNIVFSVSLVPQVVYCYKSRKGLVTLKTSVPTFIALYAVSVALLSLELYYSGILSSITATLWLVLALQRWWYGSH